MLKKSPFKNKKIARVIDFIHSPEDDKVSHDKERYEWFWNYQKLQED